MKDYRLFFDFLWRRGRYWDQADYDDIGGYEAWRRRSMDSVGGADRPVRMGPSPQTVQHVDGGLTGFTMLTMVITGQLPGRSGSRYSQSTARSAR